MTEVANWTVETCATTGPGDLVLVGAPAGFSSFAGSVPAGPVWYSVGDGDNREAGIGTFDGISTITRSPQATLFNGVYDDDSPAPISLSGSSSVSCTFNAAAYRDLIALNNPTGWFNRATFASTTDILGEYIGFSSATKGLRVDLSVIRTDAALDDIVIEVANGPNYNLTEWHGTISALRDGVNPSVTSPVSDGMTVISQRQVLTNSYDGMVELRDFTPYGNYWLASGNIGSSAADAAMISAGRFIFPTGTIDRIRVRSADGDTFNTLSRAAVWELL